MGARQDYKIEWVEIKTGEDYDRVRGRILAIGGGLDKPIWAKVIKEKEPVKKSVPETAEVIMIVDKSGSMHGLEDDTIGGFNRFVNSQKEMPLSVNSTLVLFDSEIKIVYEDLPIEFVKGLDRETYRPGGTTSLLDAVGTIITKVRNRHKIGKRPDKTVVLIITDGAENSSQEYNKRQIKKLVNKCQKRNNWDFFYLGANVDAFAEAGYMGLTRQASVSYTATSSGVNEAYDLMSNAVYMSVKSMDRTDYMEDWKEGITDNSQKQ